MGWLDFECVLPTDRGSLHRHKYKVVEWKASKCRYEFKWAVPFL